MDVMTGSPDGAAAVLKSSSAPAFQIAFFQIVQLCCLAVATNTAHNGIGDFCLLVRGPVNYWSLVRLCME